MKLFAVWELLSEGLEAWGRGEEKNYIVND
jgi:hypothetical protein